ncbi:alpha/beta hydrolase [Streptomyces sp. NPDC001832]|uniref:alpha/beta hydrolase n=1 Tax=Streptomyces sp. NPDC001832 TaxID=3154527 RepID=UPI0033264062
MASRPRRSRLCRALLAALVVASVAVPVSGAVRPAGVPAPAPTVPGLLPAATPTALTERYAATRADIAAAAGVADGHGDGKRADALRVMADPARHFVSFDGRGGGRAVEVFGDLSRADRIAVLVPGAGMNVDNYWRLRDGAQALNRELGDRSAAVVWLGYETPATVSLAAVSSERADAAAPELRAFLGQLKSVKPAARTSLLCHSYGSVVCSRAAAGLEVADIVLYGSPGVGVDNVAEMHTWAAVWAGRGGNDWIADVPHVRLELPTVEVGFGADPVSEGFGAHTFDAGSGGHSDYLEPDSVPLKNIARIVDGRTPDAPHA